MFNPLSLVTNGFIPAAVAISIATFGYIGGSSTAIPTNISSVIVCYSQLDAFISSINSNIVLPTYEGSAGGAATFNITQFKKKQGNTVISIDKNYDKIRREDEEVLLILSLIDNA